jgi:hypothetical protein
MDYITPEQQSDWAAELLESVGDSSSSISSVVQWLRTNLGELNARLSTSFTLSEDNNIEPALNDIQAGIYNELFICFWLKKKARTTLGAMEYDWVEMQGEDQGSIKRVSHTAKAAAYQSMAKDCDSSIKELVKVYRGGNFARPRQLTFNNRRSTPMNIHCACFSWSDLNPVGRYLH